ncbi:MAG: hypothetical protein FWE58_01820 [Methanobrevibacter sp.]|nr:hypothetical protein [Methanobrevibacter sp.]
MYKKIFLILSLIISLTFVVGAVSAAENDFISRESPIYFSIDKSIANQIDNDDSNSKYMITSSKQKLIQKTKIKNISKSKSTFKAGTKIRITVSVDKSIKKVSGSIIGKSNHKFKKMGYEFKKNKNKWYCYLDTKKYKTGQYTFKIKAVDGKKNIYKNSTYFTVNNRPPKVFSLKTNTKKITAGNKFHLEITSDKSSKKVIAKVRGYTFHFKQHAINNDNNTNKKNWTLNGKLSYKEIGNLKISVYTYDSLGNSFKKSIKIKSTPRYVYWNGSVSSNRPNVAYYSNPINAYQRSINELNKYVAVYEGYAGDDRTLGITYMGRLRINRVIIAYKDPFVVYHEMGHVLNWHWTEYQCDLYAYNKVGYWLL